METVCWAILFERCGTDLIWQKQVHRTVPPFHRIEQAQTDPKR